MILEDSNIHSAAFNEFRQRLGAQFDIDILETDIEEAEYGE